MEGFPVTFNRDNAELTLKAAADPEWKEQKQVADYTRQIIYTYVQNGLMDGVSTFTFVKPERLSQDMWRVLARELWERFPYCMYIKSSGNSILCPIRKIIIGADEYILKL